jgi:hypothetical protein
MADDLKKKYKKNEDDLKTKNKNVKKENLKLK